ncbi:hypothetical protein [Nocardioides sp. B-3]|uniref:hypothetical protein n=1 Tax=Nocardioides sp. B-3 TaxID=2895565 RepID=UPI002152C460|nr:hypothetical protein [Nocardioides sp. B-3]UUZ61390.1 hypothetical protein LP418_12920 [Nocardioides sp. B-3]
MTGKLGIALAATVVLLAGCGGGDGRPSVDEISTVLSEGGEIGGEDFSIPEEQADCVAKAFHESDLSDDALNAMVDKDEDYEASDADEKALTDISTETVAACMTPATN